jgi:hypothetical protein
MQLISIRSNHVGRVNRQASWRCADSFGNSASQQSLRIAIAGIRLLNLVASHFKAIRFFPLHYFFTMHSSPEQCKHNVTCIVFTYLMQQNSVNWGYILEQRQDIQVASSIPAQNDVVDYGPRVHHEKGLPGREVV